MAELYARKCCWHGMYWNSLVVELKHRFAWTVLQRAGFADAKASGKSNRWKYERCGYNRWSKREHSHSRQWNRRTIVLTLVRRHWLLEHWVYSELWTDWWTRILWTTFLVEYNRLQSLLVNLGCPEQQRWKCWNGRWTRLQGTIGSWQGVRRWWARTVVCYVCMRIFQDYCRACVISFFYGWSESEHAGGVHEICGNLVSVMSSLLLMTRPDLLGRSCWLMRIAVRPSCVHLEASLCQGKVRPHTSCCLVARISVPSPAHNHCKNGHFRSSCRSRYPPLLEACRFLQV